MIRLTQGTAIALFVVALMVLVGAAPFAANQDAGAAQGQKATAIQGELVKVDADAKTIAVRTSDDMTVVFEYTDDTKVTGAQDSAAGLATAKDVQVTVQFTEKGDTKIATQIEVHPAPAK